MDGQQRDECCREIQQYVGEPTLTRPCPGIRGLGFQLARCQIQAVGTSDRSPRSFDCGDETIDLGQLVPPLSVRAPTQGDRFSPLGMTKGSMPLADFLRGRHVPRPERSHVPVVCDQNGIAWVVGHRIAERVRVTGQTREKLGLLWVTGKPGETGPDLDGSRG